MVLLPRSGLWNFLKLFPFRVENKKYKYIYKYLCVCTFIIDSDQSLPREYLSDRLTERPDWWTSITLISAFFSSQFYLSLLYWLKKEKKDILFAKQVYQEAKYKKKKTRGDINLETLTGVKILDLSFVKDQASVSFFFPIACQ